MSLWSKPINSIGFNDVEEFCAAGLPESESLDYKSEMPSKVEDSMAAFANSMGGMLLIGVEASQTDNKPRNPVTGMKLGKGVREQIEQKCFDAIYPSLVPEISGVLENPNLPGHGVLVIRVPQSPEAPHATRSRTHIPIRSGDITRRVQAADIDRIEQLFRRRSQAERDRERHLEHALRRAGAHIKDKDLAVAVVSILPYYVWRELCSLESAHQFHQSQPDLSLSSPQRAPFGSFSRDPSYFTVPNADPTAVSTVTTKGLICMAKQLSPIPNSMEVPFWELARTVNRVLGSAQQFYVDRAPYSGFLQVSLDLYGVQNVRMSRARQSDFRPSPPFPDSEFHSSYTTNVHELVDQEFDNYYPYVRVPLFAEVAHGFDIILPASGRLE